MSRQRALVFDCEGASLVGVAEIPATPKRIGIVVITGGPQYRVGSHRQFVLLCRELAEHQFASLRFDFRGCGDSTPDKSGIRPSFEALAPDIAASIDALMQQVPELSQVVLIGLCDAASAASMYASQDQRVCGLIMLNPWVRTSGTLERAQVRNYYPARLASASFWKRLLTGKINVLQSLGSLAKTVAVARSDTPSNTSSDGDSFLQRMLTGITAFDGKLFVILSGQDLTAQEYRDLIKTDDDWRQQSEGKNIEHCEIAEANHTFGKAVWREAVARHCLGFLQRLSQ